MKKRKNELDVDFIGGTRLLTRDEEETISKFIKASKENMKNKVSKARTSSGKKINT